ALTGHVALVGGQRIMPAVGTVPFGEWSHVALSWDRSTLRAYVNGIEVGQQASPAGTLPPWSNALSVGCGRAPNGPYFQGALADVAVSALPLGGDEIALITRDLIGYRPSQQAHHWARYKDGFFDILLAPAGGPYLGSGFANDTNDHGQVVGSQWLTGGGTAAMMFDPTTGWTNLNDTISPQAEWQLDDAKAINNAGQISGIGLHAGRHAAFRIDTRTNEVVDLGNKPEYPYGVSDLFVIPNDMNAAGDVAGAVYDQWPFWALRAFIYDNQSGLTDLNSLI